MPSTVHVVAEKDGSVQITWSVAGDESTLVELARFDIYYGSKESSKRDRYTLGMTDQQLQKGIFNT